MSKSTNRPFRNIPWLLFTVAFLLLAQMLPAQRPGGSLTLQLDSIYPISGLPGFAVAVVSKDKVIYERGFGYADTEAKKAFTPYTIQNIGSVSKTFIAPALLQLIEQGKFTLDTDINELLPFKVFHPRFKDTPITVRHLATHTSGIQDLKIYNDNCYVLKEPVPSDLTPIPKENRKAFKALADNVDVPAKEFLEDYLTPGGSFFKKKNFTKNAPGTHYEYTNIGAALAGLVVQHVSGQSYTDYSKTHILQPLGMNASGWSLDEVKMEQHAVTYFTNGTPVPRYSLVTKADGGLISSCHDLANYLRQMMKGYFGESKLINPASFKEIMGLQFQEDNKMSGIFWELKPNGTIGHNGGDPGIFTYIQFDPATNRGWVFVTNTSAYEDSEKLRTVGKIWRALKEYGNDE